MELKGKEINSVIEKLEDVVGKSGEKIINKHHVLVKSRAISIALWSAVCLVLSLYFGVFTDIPVEVTQYGIDDSLRNTAVVIGVIMGLISSGIISTCVPEILCSKAASLENLINKIGD